MQRRDIWSIAKRYRKACAIARAVSTKWKEAVVVPSHTTIQCRLEISNFFFRSQKQTLLRFDLAKPYTIALARETTNYKRWWRDGFYEYYSNRFVSFTSISVLCCVSIGVGLVESCVHQSRLVDFCFFSVYSICFMYRTLCACVFLRP